MNCDLEQKTKFFSNPIDISKVENGFKIHCFFLIDGIRQQDLSNYVVRSTTQRHEQFFGCNMTSYHLKKALN